MVGATRNSDIERAKKRALGRGHWRAEVLGEEPAQAGESEKEVAKRQL